MAGIETAALVESQSRSTVTNRPGQPGQSHSRRAWSDLLASKRPIVITIDGPAASGKSSVARELAQRLGLELLNTGAMYRAAAAVLIQAGLDQRSDPITVVRAVEAADIRFDFNRRPPMILAYGQPMEDRIEDEDVTQLVSPIAGIAELRAHMVDRQQHVADTHPRLVSEGRDQGSVVFPHAAVKFFLKASSQVRALRRATQMRARGLAPNLLELQRLIEARDRSDESRLVGPLVCPDDAIVVDTSPMNFEQVVETLEREVLARVLV